MNTSVVNNEEGNIIEKASTVLGKRLSVEAQLDVRRANPLQKKKFLQSVRNFNLPNRRVLRKKRQKFTKKLKPCYICADWGHNGNFCPQVTTCSICCKEESKNDVEDHTSLFCLKCGGTGHGMFSCTNDYDPEDLKGIQCYICMDFGHLCCHENSTEGPSEASCYNCGQSGHHGFECIKMNVVANKLQPVTICFKCQKGVHSPATATETAKLEKDPVPNKSTKRKPRKTRARELHNKSNSSNIYTAGKDFVQNSSVKGNSRKAPIAGLDNTSTSAETTLLGKDTVPNEFDKKRSRNTRAGKMVKKPTSDETGTVRNDAIPDKSIEEKSQKTRRGERKRKRKLVMPTSNVVQSLPTMPMTGNTIIPRHGQYYGNSGSNAWLPPPTAASRNCLVNSPALNQYSHGRPGLNVWLPPPAAAARNCHFNSPALNQSSHGRPGLNVWLPPPASAARNFEISPAVNQSSYQTGFHFYPYNTNYREVSHAPPNPFHLRSLHPHEIFHQRTQIPGTPQNRIHLPHQNFTYPRSTFDSHMGISQQPELPHHVSNNQISASLPQHQLASHRKWTAPPRWKPYS